MRPCQLPRLRRGVLQRTSRGWRLTCDTGKRQVYTSIADALRGIAAAALDDVRIHIGARTRFPACAGKDNTIP